ncbi:MAG: glycosyltransferase family 9 protein [Methylomonas sp.]
MSRMYQGRIKKPVDIIKQPWLDFERFISFAIYKHMKSRVISRRYPDVVKKVLLIRRNRLGDAVNVLPIIEGIKECQPDVEIHMLANQYNQVIFQYSPYVDKVHAIDEKWLLGKFTLFMHPELLKLREENFDLVIGLSGYSSVTAQLVAWVKGKYNVGSVSKKGTLYDLIFDLGARELDTADKHHVDDMAHIVRLAKLKLPNTLPYTKLLRPNPAQQKWLAICPDVKRKESRYPIEQYGQMIFSLLSGKSVDKILLFTEGPRSEYRQLEQFGAEWRNTANVEEFIREVSKCQVAVTAEGGSAHITGALGLGVVVISGMGHQAYWRPYAQHVRILEQKHAIGKISPEAIIAEIDALENEMNSR